MIVSKREKNTKHLVINLHHIKYLAPGFLEIELSISSNTNDEMTDFATIREICGKKKTYSGRGILFMN